MKALAARPVPRPMCLARLDVAQRVLSERFQIE